jgi:hypothetical protein
MLIAAPLAKSLAIKAPEASQMIDARSPRSVEQEACV